MFGARVLNRHAALMNRMADTLGVDLEEALRRGKLSSEHWRDALVSCAGCDDPEGCVHWLGAHQAPEDRSAAMPPPEVPDFCNNRLMMERLSAELKKLGPIGAPRAPAPAEE
ncbi:MAG: DUF6455 family protein [Paracoccaceae bacterium]